MEYSHALKSEPRIEKWAWSFRNFAQWHALAFVLAELGYRSGTEVVDRAWHILDEVLGDWDSLYEQNRASPLWRPMNRLIIRARQVREADMKARSASSQQVRPPSEPVLPTLQHLQTLPEVQMQTDGTLAMQNNANHQDPSLDFATMSGTGDINPQSLTASPIDYFSALSFAPKPVINHHSQSFDSTYGTSLSNSTSLGVPPTSMDNSMLADIGELPDASAPDFSYIGEFFTGFSAEDCANLARTTPLG